MEHTEELSHPKDEKDGEFSHQLPSVISLNAVPRDVTSLALPGCLAPSISCGQRSQRSSQAKGCRYWQ